ncbi:MAG: hypothetical protein AAB500_00015 [Patescibacteria group bacterium]
MEILGKIFGSAGRVKILRLFLLNKGKGFKVAEIAKRSRVATNAVRRELRTLDKVGFARRKGTDWSFNSNFPYAAELEELLVNSDTIDHKEIGEDFRKTGRVKLLILSGIFIKNKDSRVDLLLVGERLKRAKIDEKIKKLEAEIGSELSYAVFDTKEFIYRLNMYDKLVRDVLDFPHVVLWGSRELSRELSTQAPKKA